MADILLEVNDAVYPEQELTNIIHFFPVSKRYKKLHITFTYQPKYVYDEEVCRPFLYEGAKQYDKSLLNHFEEQFREHLPLSNFLTLSFDDASGAYRGCAHRHNPTQEHEIGEDFASLGFYRGAIDTGDWRAVINVHAIITGDVTYHLKIEGEE